MPIINNFLKLTLFSFIIYVSTSFFCAPVYADTVSISSQNTNDYTPYQYNVTLDTSSYKCCFGISRYNSNFFNVGFYIDGDISSVNAYLFYGASYANRSETYRRSAYNLGVSYFSFDAICSPVVGSSVPIIINFDDIGNSNRLYSYSSMQTVRDYFDIPDQVVIYDSDLDISGLNAWVGSDQFFGSDDNSVSAAFSNFVESLVNSLIPNSASSFVDSNKVFTNQLGTVRTTIPGINLIWDSPDIGVNLSGVYPDLYPTYTFWIDGSTSATLHLYQHKDSCNLTLSKFELYSGQLYDNPNTTSYYNTNSSYQKILDYVASNNSSFSSSVVENITNGSCVLNTSISRVYLQASLIDLDGNIHQGAVSYVDISADGSCFVYEGVTENLEDISSSYDDGFYNDVDQPLTVSGDTIIYGDTITNNNSTSIVSPGLTVGDGSNFFSAGLALINAILELIKLLFVSWLVPLIKLGWTGTP